MNRACQNEGIQLTTHPDTFSSSDRHQLVEDFGKTNSLLVEKSEQTISQEINLSSVTIDKLHKQEAVRVTELPYEVPSGMRLQKLRKQDAVYLRDLKQVATLVGV